MQLCRVCFEDKAENKHYIKINMSYKEVFYPECRFGGLTDIDGTIIFYTRVNSLLNPSFTVLDLGCGRGVGQEDPVEISRKLRTLRKNRGQVYPLLFSL